MQMSEGLLGSPAPSHPAFEIRSVAERPALHRQFILPFAPALISPSRPAQALVPDQDPFPIDQRKSSTDSVQKQDASYAQGVVSLQLLPADSSSAPPTRPPCLGAR